MNFINENPALDISPINTLGCIFIKDTNSKYLDLTQNAAQLFGWKSADCVKGKTDYDAPSPLSECADHFRTMDKKVLDTGQKLLTLEILNMNFGWTALLVQKSPLLDNIGQTIGVFAQALEISYPILLKQYRYLNRTDNKVINPINKPAIYILNPEHSPLPLTPRQEACVFLLVRGKTVKEVAYILGISVRTAESHIESIKHKLGCNTKGQVIEKALDAGFLHYIPEELLNKLQW